MKSKYLALVILFSAVEVNADNSTLDAAIGGGIGGAAGAAIGNEVGGRDGAIIGGALGGAVGVAVNTDKHSHESSPPKPVHYEYAPSRGAHPQGYHCPPGQRKKGRC
jgi:phage tail tape-measure protein